MSWTSVLRERRRGGWVSAISHLASKLRHGLGLRIVGILHCWLRGQPSGELDLETCALHTPVGAGAAAEALHASSGCA